jgi:hypothetical protein
MTIPTMILGCCSIFCAKTDPKNSKAMTLCKMTFFIAQKYAIPFGSAKQLFNEIYVFNQNLNISS